MGEGGPGNKNYAQMEVMGETAWRGPGAGREYPSRRADAGQRSGQFPCFLNRPGQI